MEAQKSILLIEDEKFLNQLLKNRLQKEGIKVTIAFNGEEGLKFLRSEKFDLILLDLILPRISGFELMEIISADPSIKSSPIIIISNLGQETDIAKGKCLGAIEYFIKARVSIDELIKQIKKFMGAQNNK